MISDKGKVIRDLISKFSEDWWHAGWMNNIEHSVWILGNRDDKENRMAEEAKRIVNLGKEFDLWVRWNDDLEFIEGYCVEEIPMSEWIEFHKKYYNQEE